MPIYRYQTDDGLIQEELESRPGKQPKFIIRRGQKLWPVFCGVTNTPVYRDGPQMSAANGIIGTEADLKAAMKKDAARGVPIRYIKTHEHTARDGTKRFAWAAEFGSRSEKNRWLRANLRHDRDAGYSDPAPGFTNGKYPHEFEGKNFGDL